MEDFNKFRIEALHNHTVFKVLVRGLFGWKSGYVYTDYFLIQYNSEQEALQAIEKYKNRFTDV